MTPNPQQLPLSVSLRSDARLDRFVEAEPSPLIPMLANAAKGEAHEPFIYLHGASGSGKSYLLQAVCNAADVSGFSSIYLPLTERAEYSVEMLDGLEQFDLLCIDGVDQIDGDIFWQEGLFHLYNRVRDAGGVLIVSGDQTPANLRLELADLKSRLAWGLSFKLHPISDDQKVSALQKNAEDRGLQLNDELAKYLLSRGSRELSDQLGYLEALDQASLQHQRKLTIPFAKQVLGWQ